MWLLFFFVVVVVVDETGVLKVKQCSFACRKKGALREALIQQWEDAGRAQRAEHAGKAACFSVALETCFGFQFCACWGSQEKHRQCRRHSLLTAVMLSSMSPRPSALSSDSLSYTTDIGQRLGPSQNLKIITQLYSHYSA